MISPIDDILEEIEEFHFKVKKDRESIIALRNEKWELWNKINAEVSKAEQFDGKLFRYDHGRIIPLDITDGDVAKAHNVREAILLSICKNERLRIPEIREEISKTTKPYKERVFKDILIGEPPNYDGKCNITDLLLAIEKAMETFIQ